MGKVLYKNAKFYTEGKEKVDALYAVDGIIEKLGQECNMMELHQEADEVIDLKEMYAYPDFCRFIEDVEFDLSESGEEMLELYFRKMAKKVLDNKVNMYLEEGDEANFAVYAVDLLKSVSNKGHPDGKYLVVNGEIKYDEEAYADEQWMWLLMTQRF